MICGEDNALGSYTTCIFSYFGDKLENEENNNDNIQLVQVEPVSDKDGDANSTPLVASSPATSLTQWTQHTSKGTKNPSMLSDPLVVVDEMASTIKNLTHWTKTLYERVIRGL
ncbi:hypothetical protein IHE45_04G058800 [Dioscorea alata]|uniref:Uncharacterized protein n=1 Tax=Dioscorea alata TaxID=55571 RepID=A0ACB7WCZ7_DIOAL|nr:hypothetical protein IHE45_04G058800 [Dioscorea alata]